MSEMDDEKKRALRAAQREVGLVMASCLGMWFLPFVSGFACNAAEAKLVEMLAVTVRGEAEPPVCDALFWFFRKKMLFLNAATYVPALGTAIQAAEVYALGQFVIHCLQDEHLDSSSQDNLQHHWDAIEEQIFSGEKVVASYEDFTETKFPSGQRGSFIKAVDWMSRAYRGAERVPGVTETQEAVGGGIEKAVKWSLSGLKRIVERSGGKEE